MRLLVLLFLGFIASLTLDAQKVELTYYLPDIKYNSEIPTPQEVLDFQVGEWHVSHDQLINYMKILSEKSDRVEIQEYARSHENRPLYILLISSPDNLKRKEQIRKDHVDLTFPEKANNVNLDNLPTMLYQGYSIHGNEASGANASMLVAYYLAAGQSEEVINILNQTFILLDPAYNPDGLNRFASWVNTHKSKTLVSDSQDREYNEAWPGGRTNHYWFDLNRDWLLLTHPESRGRIKNFHHWKPNILTDHHEMGTNSTFFFQPGVPSRTNPNTPQQNQDLTEEIGSFHAAALDSIGSLYFTKSRFDDYYYGKGSTYPDVNGSIGILFEQASSRGHYQESVNGILTFPFTIRNQVVTSLSTQRAAVQMRKKLLNYKKDFYRNAKSESDKMGDGGYVIADRDLGKLDRFLKLLLAHKIEVYTINDDAQVEGHQYKKENSYFIPHRQQQYKLIKTIFEDVKSFRDSIFYDVSAWTLPRAFDLTYNTVASSGKVKKENLITEISARKGQIYGAEKAYAFVMRWEEYFAPTVLYQIQKSGLRTKVITEPITLPLNGSTQFFDRGSVVISTQNQNLSRLEINALLSDLTNTYGVDLYGVKTGYGAEMTLGNPDVISLESPSVMLVVGEGVSSYDAGEVWFQIDTRLKIPLSHVPTEELDRANLNKYTSIIMVQGNYRNLTEGTVDKIEKWVAQGGNLILFRSAIDWAISKKLVTLSKVSNSRDDKEDVRPYYAVSDDSGSKVLGGAIFQTLLDLSHPLCYGYPDNEMAVFRKGTTFYEQTKNPYASPVRYSPNPLLSGYIPKGLDQKAANTAAVTVHARGSGNVIAINDNLNFRGYWWGGSKMFANSIFYGSIISGSSKER